MSENSERIMLTLDLRMLLQKDCAETNQRPATRILWILTEYYKDRLSPEVYQELHERYEMTAFEQREVKAQKEQEKEKKRAKVNVKLKNQLIQIERDLASCDLRIKDPKTNKPSFWEERKKGLEEKKGVIEAQLAKGD